MKVFRLFCLFAVIILGAVGCSNDDDEFNNSIVGAWQSEIHTYRIWVFTDDGKVVSDDEYGTYDLKGNRLDILWTDEYGNYEESFLVVELTSDTMVLDELDEDGIALEDPEAFRRIDMGND